MIVAVFVFVTGCVFGLNTLSADAPRLAAFHGLGVFALACSSLALWKLRTVRLGWSDLAVLAVLAWAGASVLWSPDWRGGVWSLTHIAVFATVYFLAKTVENPRPIYWGVCLSICAILGIEAFGRYRGVFLWGGFGNENFLSEYLVIALPFAVPLLRWSR